MGRTFFIALVTAACLAASSSAASADLARLSDRHALLDRHQDRLEQLLSAQVERISRLKAQPAGVRRDFQLKEALRENQQLAGKLTALQKQIRQAGDALLAAYDRAIAAEEDAGRRRALRQRRAELVRGTQARPARIVTGEPASPLDGPEELEEKADLLADSEEKIERQIKRIERQISRLQQRARLQRHSRAVDDSPFVEDSPRRLARSKTSGAPAATRDDAPQSPAKERMDGDATTPPASDGAEYADPSSGLAPAPGNDSWTGGGGAESPAQPPAVGTTGPAMTVNGVLDPSIVRDLERAARTGSLKDRITALREARDRLARMAGKLDAQAKKLRQRARSGR